MVPDKIPVPEVSFTNKIRNAVKEADKVKNIDSQLKQKCQQFLTTQDPKTVIPISMVKEVFQTLKNDGRRTYLHELLEGTDFVPTPYEPPPRDPELDARVQKLKIKEENAEYRRMTQNVDPTQGNIKFSLQSEVKTMNRQLTSVINFLITVAAGFAFGYKLVEYTFGRNLPMQMMAGLSVGTVIFFVDLYFMVKYEPNL